MIQQEVWTILKILAWTKDFLAGKGVQNARLEAEWLLCAATGLDRVGLYLQFDKPLSADELTSYRAMVTRRARREPLQHILGTQEFYGLDYEVSSDTLIPRHDTEVLIDQALYLKPDARSILDIGTGSGCIAITLATNFPDAVVTATDISEAALAVTKRNVKKHSVNLEILLGSLFDPLSQRKFDLIVSNPPYIPTGDICGLEPEVRDFDPFTALNGGADGLDIYRSIIPDSVLHINPGGWLILEVGVGQAADVMKIFNETGAYYQPITALDPGGVVRVVAAQLKELL